MLGVVAKINQSRHDGSCAHGSLGLAERGGARQPERQDHGSRRVVRLRLWQKVKGCKRQAMVVTDARTLVPDPQAANVQGHDRAVRVLRLSRPPFPFVAKAVADAGFAGKPAPSEICPLLTSSFRKRTTCSRPRFRRYAGDGVLPQR